MAWRLATRGSSLHQKVHCCSTCVKFDSAPTTTGLDLQTPFTTGSLSKALTSSFGADQPFYHCDNLFRILIQLETCAPTDSVMLAVGIPPAETCAICLEPASGTMSHLAVCHHGFHSECIAEWVDKAIGIPTCPLCREPTVNDDLTVVGSLGNDKLMFVDDNNSKMYYRCGHDLRRESMPVEAGALADSIVQYLGTTAPLRFQRRSMRANKTSHYTVVREPWNREHLVDAVRLYTTCRFKTPRQRAAFVASMRTSPIMVTVCGVGTVSVSSLLKSSGFG